MQIKEKEFLLLQQGILLQFFNLVPLSLSFRRGGKNSCISGYSETFLFSNNTPPAISSLPTAWSPAGSFQWFPYIPERFMGPNEWESVTN